MQIPCINVNIALAEYSITKNIAIAFILSRSIAWIIRPFWISSVNSDNLFGADIESTAPAIAKIKEIIIKTL